MVVSLEPLSQALKTTAMVFAGAFLEALKTTAIVFALMVAIEYAEVRWRRRIRSAFTGRPWRQYLTASLLGLVPGCVTAWLVVGLYVRGIASFGALVAVMLSTAGDEGLIMLARIPKSVPLLFGMLAAVGVLGGGLADWLTKRLNLELCKECAVPIHEDPAEQIRGLRHFLSDHVWGHIARRHLPRLFAWILGMILLLDLAGGWLKAEALAPAGSLALLLAAALVGLLPTSGPHLAFVLMFAKHQAPFSVLLTNSLVQDGHGLLPLLHHTRRDAIYLKGFDFILGLAVGIPLWLLGH